MHGKTKTVCTLGPSTSSVEMLVQMIHAGMDVVRLNFSHGTYEDHLMMLQNVQEAVRRTGEQLAVLQDLQGPKIRIGDFSVPFIELRTGAHFTITTDPIMGDEHRVNTTYTNLTKDVQTGDKILLDDGKLRLRVLEIKANDVLCEVVVGGTLSAHKGINLPGVSVSAPSFTAKDLLDLEFQMESGRDLTRLPALTHYGVLQLIGEVGTDLSVWPTEKHFTAWTGLAPGNHDSGKRKGRARRRRNRAGQLFCMIAQSLVRSKDIALGGFYRRLAARRGGLVATKALARKLAAWFWRVMVKGDEYVERGLADYEERVRKTKERALRRLAKELGQQLVPASTSMKLTT